MCTLQEMAFKDICVNTFCRLWTSLRTVFIGEINSIPPPPFSYSANIEMCLPIK